jgi:hypothetical protein
MPQRANTKDRQASGLFKGNVEFFITGGKLNIEKGWQTVNLPVALYESFCYLVYGQDTDVHTIYYMV